jgi:hypothetical protein
MNNGVGLGYQTNTNSVFYTVEQEVFQAIETYGNLAVCMTATNNRIDIPEITLYPNPVEQMLQLTGLDIPGKQTYSITNTAGQEVLKGTISPENRLIQFDNLTPGVYVFSCNGLPISFVKE